MFVLTEYHMKDSLTHIQTNRDTTKDNILQYSAGIVVEVKLIDINAGDATVRKKYKNAQVYTGDGE